MVERPRRDSLPEARCVQWLGRALPPAQAVAKQAHESAAEQGESSGLGHATDAAEQTVVLDVAVRPGDACSEIQSVGEAAIGAIAKREAP